MVSKEQDVVSALQPYHLNAVRMGQLRERFETLRQLLGAHQGDISTNDLKDLVGNRQTCMYRKQARKEQHTMTTVRFGTATGPDNSRQEIGTVGTSPDGKRLVYGGAHPDQAREWVLGITEPYRPEDHPKGLEGFLRYFQMTNNNGYSWAYEVEPDEAQQASQRT